MDYEQNVCPYDVGQLLTAKEVLNWAVEQEERVHNNIHVKCARKPTVSTVGGIAQIPSLVSNSVAKIQVFSEKRKKLFKNLTFVRCDVQFVYTVTTVNDAD